MASESLESVSGLSDWPKEDIDLDQTDQYLKVLSQHVFNNDLILSKIFSHFSLKELSISCQVCYKWLTECKRVIANRSQSLHIYHLFRTNDRHESFEDTRIDEETCMSWGDKYDFESNIAKAISNGLQSLPVVCLIIYGSFGEDVRLKHRLNQTEIVRKSLPMADNCRLVNLNSQCLIGFPTTSTVPIEKISHFGDLAAVSLFLIPSYRSGVQITLFNSTDMREKIFQVPDIKAIVIFTTSSIFQDNRNLYMEITSMSRFISQSYQDGIAFGGYNSAYFSFNKKDFLNYMDGDLPGSCFTATGEPQPNLGAYELIGLCFSGPDVRASSIVMNTKRTNKTEQKLRLFKKCLGFEPKNNRSEETFAFMFTDEEKTEAFVKLNIFRNIFIGCEVVGISGYGQYGMDCWPGMNSTGASDKKSNTFGGNANAKRVKSTRLKKRIILNTNMTTFVVINVKKKFI